MARKNIPTTTTEEPQIDATAAADIQKTGAAIVAAAANDNQKAAAIVNQRVGRKQMMQVFSKLVTVTDLVDLQNLKESKGYKDHTVIDPDGKLVTLRTWEDYCQIVEGRSRESVDLDLKNLNALGPELFESMRTVGIGPSTMRAIRQLPDDDQQLIQQAVSTTDKDELAEFVEQIITKNAKEKAALSKKLDDAQADLVAKDEVAAQNASRINELQEKVARIKKTAPDETDAEIRKEVAQLTSSIDHELRVNLYNALQTQAEHGEEHGIATADFITAQITQLEASIALLRRDLIKGVEWE